jgi:hypothetical protein
MNQLPLVTFDDEFEHAYVRPRNGDTTFTSRQFIDRKAVRQAIVREFERIHQIKLREAEDIKNIGYLDMVYSEEGIEGDRLIPFADSGVHVVKMIECQILVKERDE